MVRNLRSGRLPKPPENGAAAVVLPARDEIPVQGDAANRFAETLDRAATHRRAWTTAQSHRLTPARPFSYFFLNNPAPMWVYDLETLAFLEVNDAAQHKYGYSRDEFLRMMIADIRPPEDVAYPLENIARSGEGGDEAGGRRHRLKNGSLIDVEVTSHAVTFEGRLAEIVLVTDITSQRQSEARVRHLGRLYAILSQANQAIVRIKDPASLFEEICRVTVELGGFRMAWIGLIDPETGMVRPAAHAGHEAGYLEEVFIGPGDGPYTRGPTGKAIREGGLSVCEDMRTDPRMGPWRQQALARGYLSSASVPLKTGGEVVGTLNLYAAETGFAGEEVRQLLEAIGTDISFALDAMESERERRRVEDELRARAQIIEQCSHAIIATDLDGIITSWNSGAERLLGYSALEAVGQPVSMLRFEADLERDFIAPLRASGSHEVEVSFRRKTGERLEALLSLWLLRDPGGQPVGMVGYAVDIGQRIAAEKQTAEALRYLQTIIDSSPIGIITCRESGEAISANEAAARISGVPVDRLLRQNFRTLESLRGTEILAAAERAFVSVAETQVESDFVSGTGKQASLACRFVPFEYEGERRLLVLFMDVTESRRAAAERERLEARLLQARKMESVGRLAGGIAHDFNNMLTVILGYTEIIKAGLHDKALPGEEILEIERAANRSRDIVRQLLAFSRKQTASPRLLNLNQVIGESQNALARLIGEDIELSFLPGEGLGRIRMDPSQLDQIIVNLAANARDAMPHGGKLIIETAGVQVDEAFRRRHGDLRPGHHALLTVSDNGIGMDEQTRQQIFDPFFTTKEMGRGTGLGLSTVFGIVNQNGGMITVYSEPGHGATFKIYLPCLPDEAAEFEGEKQEEEPRGTETILLVEDDEMVLKLTTTMLTALGYTVLTAETPAAALALADEVTARIDLLATDVVMPEMNGRELSERIAGRRPGIRTLFISGYSTNAVTLHALLDPGTILLQKPFSRIDLARKVREALAGS